jgi:2',3'-cyclic-nucleotide 2'-phosphodiesterase (5'-nucleotidase family)
MKLKLTRSNLFSISLLIFSTLTAVGCGKNMAVVTQDYSVTATQPAREAKVAAIKKLSFVLTNDIHGHVEPGLPILGGIVSHLRSLPEYKNENAALFVLDSGDQFQGTLLSNFDEGKAVFKAFNEIGYDAIVPGNHDYDFGPIGWLFDQVTENETSQNPREVIENLASIAKFPLLSANTYFKASIKAASSTEKLSLDSQCLPTDRTMKHALDFSTATSPAFLKPYVIIEKAGVRVALIGLDNHATASTTTVANVADLCFRDEVETYVEIRKALEGKADVFVLLMHQGNSSNSNEGSEIVRKINEAYPNGVNLAAEAHTHFVHNDLVGDVRVIQDGAESKFFGRVDLYFDTESKKLISEKTASNAGIQINKTACVTTDRKNDGKFVCEQYAIPVTLNSAILKVISDLNETIAPMANEVVGIAKEKLTRTRIDESALGNILTDALRKATGSDISFMNAGGVRTDLNAGTILYRDLFEVLPFNNRAVIMNAVQWKTLKKVLLKAIQTCGNYGTLYQSGLRIQFSRDCSKGDLDLNARLIKVEMGDQTLYDEKAKIEIAADHPFRVTNLDFLASGGSGYADFKEATTDEVLDIARELIVDVLVKDKPEMTNQLDGRFTQK